MDLYFNLAVESLKNIMIKRVFFYFWPRQTLILAKKPQNIDRRLNMQIEAHGLNIRVEDVDLLYNLYRKTKAPISFTVNV